jgi:hypothetical protein
MARPTLFAHQKFRRLAHMLGAPDPHVTGYLELMWHVAYESGNPRLGDATDVELAAKWPGEPGKLCDAMLRCGGDGRAGFIEEDPDRPGTFQIHDLFDHAPDYVRKRGEREAERVRLGKTLSDRRRDAANARWHPEDVQPDASGSQLQLLALQADADGAPPAPAPAPMELCSDATPARRSKPDKSASAGSLWGKPPIQFDTVNRSWLGITDLDRATWRAAYPAVDLDRALANMIAWIVANPAKGRKTNYAKFIAGWLSRDQDKGGDLRGKASGGGARSVSDDEFLRGA